MKKIIATSLNYSPIQNLTGVTYYYESGEKKTIEINRLRNPQPAPVYSLVRYYTEEFYFKNRDTE